MRRSIAGAAGVSGIVLSCATTPSNVTFDAGTGMGLRVPDVHRAAAGATCPQGRGSGMLDPACNYDGGPRPACRTDADCTAGKNGRCVPTPGIACAPECTYDTCFSDADCAKTPCVCRGSASDSAANVCAPGNCAVDADCGAGGYCSPSGLPDRCGLGYYCHTSSDACANNSDCPSTREGCNFTFSLGWSCSATCTLPP